MVDKCVLNGAECSHQPNLNATTAASDISSNAAAPPQQQCKPKRIAWMANHHGFTMDHAEWE